MSTSLAREINNNKKLINLRLRNVSRKDCEVSSQFSTSQLYDLQHSYVIILAARLMGTPFGRQIVLSIHKKMVKENSLGAKVGYF